MVFVQRREESLTRDWWSRKIEGELIAGKKLPPTPTVVPATVPPTAGATSTPSAGQAPVQPSSISPPTPQFTDNLGGYIARVYDAPFSGSGDYNKFLLNPRYKAYKKRLTQSGINYNINSVCSNLTLLVDSDLNGDLTLIDGLNGVQVTKEQEIRSITEDKLQSFSPDAKYVLMNSKIFEMFPDSMRNKMSINSAVGGANPNYSH